MSVLTRASAMCSAAAMRRCARLRGRRRTTSRDLSPDRRRGSRNGCIALSPPPPSSSSQACLAQAKFDKEKLKTLGVDAFFTYGVVSNINAGFTVALAWGTFSKASGLSPLAPGQWKAFLVT